MQMIMQIGLNGCLMFREVSMPCLSPHTMHKFRYDYKFNKQKVVALNTTPLSSWHHLTMMRQALDGGRSASKFGLTLTWMKKSNNNSGRY
jgi:hypothetical protein